MFKLFDVSYQELIGKCSNELYYLRKKTFSDRLGWNVVCEKDMEFDEFDNAATRYILGFYKGKIICSVRFIELEYPNMITHTFKDCFWNTNLPIIGIESSRFFVDKKRTKSLMREHYPVSHALFLAMVNWARYYRYDGIHTIVSRPMLSILKRSGWKIKILQEAFLNEKESIYLIYLPATDEEQARMALALATQLGVLSSSLITWPMLLPV